MTRRPPTRSWRGTTADERRAERRRRLLDAALELFGTKGIASTRVQEICAEAGLTERYFYESFENLDSLAHALFEALLDELDARVEVAVEDAADQREVIALTMGVVVDVFAEDPRRCRVLVAETLDAGGSFAAQRQQFFEIGTMRARDLLASLPGRSANAALQQLAVVGLAGAVAEVLLEWGDGQLNASRDAVVAYLTALFDFSAQPPVAG